MNTPPNGKNLPMMHPWEKFIPSKKIIIIIGVLAVAAIIYGLRNPLMALTKKLKRSSEITAETTQPNVHQSNVVLSTEKDTDGDGLLDWQETLLGTNPTIPNSKNEIPQEVRNLVNSSSTLVDTSDKLALKVYQRLQTELMGGNITEAIQAATSKEILDYANSLDQQLPTFTLDDLNLVDDTAESRASYNINVGSSARKIIPDKQQTNQVYQQILSGTKKVIPSSYETALSKTAHDLLTAPVPLGLAEPHLTLLNAVTHLQSILQKSGDTPDDKTNLYAMFLVFQKNLNLSIETMSTLAVMLKA